MSPDPGSLAPPPWYGPPSSRSWPPPQWYGPPSSRSREHGTRDHTCMHACIHPSIHPDASIHPSGCIHPSIHPSIHTYQHTYLHTYQHTYQHSYQHTNIPTYHHHRPQGGGPEEPYHHHRPRGGDQKNHTTIPGHRGGDHGGRGGAWESWVIYMYMYIYIYIVKASRVGEVVMVFGKCLIWAIWGFSAPCSIGKGWGSSFLGPCMPARFEWSDFRHLSSRIAASTRANPICLQPRICTGWFIFIYFPGTLW